MASEKKKFTYSGSVRIFGDIVTSNYVATTYAVSERAARSNFAWRYKKDHGYSNDAVCTLTGKVTLAEGTV